MTAEQARMDEVGAEEGKRAAVVRDRQEATEAVAMAEAKVGAGVPNPKPTAITLSPTINANLTPHTRTLTRP